MTGEQPISVESRIVGCDGGGGALGHPLVFLKIGAEGDVICPYCSRHFVLSSDAATALDAH